jgi:RNA polymerase sigma factor (TIGR02999 family)
MDANGSGELTNLLLDWTGGNRAAFDALLPLVYRELRLLARRYMASEKPGHTLEPTALVHEAYLRLIDQNRVSWQNRAHFFGVAAQVIRRVLVDHARARNRLKRGGADLKVTWTENIDVPDAGLDLVSLDDALKNLARLFLRRSVGRGNGCGAGHLSRYREKGLGHGPGMALSRSDGAVNSGSYES